MMAARTNAEEKEPLVRSTDESVGSPSETAAEHRGHPIFDVFFTPGATARALARKPRFISALLLITGAALLTTAVGFRRGVIEHSFREKMEADATLAQRQEPDRAAFIEQATRSSVYFAFGSAAIGPAAGILMASGILLFGLRILGNTETRFVQVLAVVSHAALPACIYMLLAIPVLLLKPPDTIEFENILPLTNLGFLFSPTGQHWAYAVASSLDLFSLWILALLTASVARLANWSRGLAFALTIFPWAGYVLLKGLFG